MTMFTVALAGLLIEINAIHPSTKHFLRDYLVPPNDGIDGANDAVAVPGAGDGDVAGANSGADPDSAGADGFVREADFVVTVSQGDIDFERRKSAEQDEADGIPVRQFSDRYLETLAVLRQIANRLPAYDTVLFHGSAVAYRGRAYMFTGPSGTGKTTHTGMWLDLLPEAHVLNGDKPFLRIGGDTVYVCGNPWQGKEDLGCNETMPLAGICLLSQAADNKIEEISFRDALPALMRQLYRPDEGLLRSVQLLGQIGERVKLWHLECNLDPQAAVVSSAAVLQE